MLPLPEAAVSEFANISERTPPLSARRSRRPARKLASRCSSLSTIPAASPPGLPRRRILSAAHRASALCHPTDPATFAPRHRPRPGCGLSAPRAARRVRSSSSTTRALRSTSHWSPPDAVSSSRAIKASRSTAEALPARRPQSRHELPGASLANAKQFCDGLPVEVTGFPSRTAEDYPKFMKPRGLLRHMGKPLLAWGSDPTQHKSFLEIDRVPAEHLACK